MPCAALRLSKGACRRELVEGAKEPRKKTKGNPTPCFSVYTVSPCFFYIEAQRSLRDTEKKDKRDQKKGKSDRKKVKGI